MILVVLGLLGLCFGSFVNALVYRLRMQSEVSSATRSRSASKKHNERQADYSVLTGRSMCPHCKHELAWYDLLPVVSWLTLKGKCRYCKKRISWQYPIVEFMTALVFVGSYLLWPQTYLYGADLFSWDAANLIQFGFWLIFAVGFMALAVYDLKWMELPNKVVYPLIGLVAVQTLVLMLTIDALSVFVNAFWGFLFVGGLFYVLFQVSGGKWIGGGDVKLGFVIGPLVGGPFNAFLLLFLASVLGTIAALPLLLKGSLKATSRLPFGPFLLLATAVVYLYGTRIKELYWSVFL